MRWTEKSRSEGGFVAALVAKKTGPVERALDSCARCVFGGRNRARGDAVSGRLGEGFRGGRRRRR